MNNFELHERAIDLMDEHNNNAYQLAKRIAELEEELKKAPVMGLPVMRI